MKVKLTRIQADWLMKVTDTSTPQEGLDYFVELMRKEGISAVEVLDYIDAMMKKGVTTEDK